MLTLLGIILIHQNGLKWCKILDIAFLGNRAPTYQDDPESVHTYALLRVTIEFLHGVFNLTQAMVSTLTYIKLSNGNKARSRKSGSWHLPLLFRRPDTDFPVFHNSNIKKSKDI